MIVLSTAITARETACTDCCHIDRLHRLRKQLCTIGPTKCHIMTVDFYAAYGKLSFLHHKPNVLYIQQYDRYWDISPNSGHIP